RFCDRSYPFRTQFKLSGTHPLPYGFRVSGLFQSVAGVQSARDGINVGRDLSIMYAVTKTNFPALTQPSISTLDPAPGGVLLTTGLRLNAVGSLFLDRVNQLALAVSRDFQVGKIRVRPQVDIFNSLNTNAITQVNTSFGPSLLQPQSVLNPRLVRLNVRVNF